MIYECTIKNPKKIRAFWIDRAEHGGGLAKRTARKRPGRADGYKGPELS